jgi:hypothetical protein
LSDSEKSQLQSDLEPIADADLKRALDALGRTVKGLRRPSNPAK